MAEKFPENRGETEKAPDKMERIVANLMQVELNSIEFVDEKSRAIKAMSRIKLLSVNDDDDSTDDDDNSTDDDDTSTKQKKKSSHSKK